MSNSSRTYVITGAASGIGRETKQLLESLGHRVIGADIRDAEVVADLGTPAGRASLVEQVTAISGGAIDAVLAIAGVDLGGPPTVAVNYYGAIATLEGLRPLLLRSNAPRAVAVSSITSVHPYNDQLLNALLDGTEAIALEKAEEVPFVYATTKRALSRWIRRNALKAEWAGANIPLNAIAPGLVKTELLKRLFDEPETRKRISAGTPMPLGGPYEPRAAAELLAWLASEQNGHMTGQTIFIDGGADVMIRGDSVW
ncbi:SDR family oxidoreductase [Paraburkholderia susongensis]|uniref:NAD(P)-dependent dehydrogenase, short-chain alcohol dehydrogenase family n=1 Tax=Paraburkholderia susongensis TaxID=1515439 RepID=A0A1X7L6V3_9BURK|nr:SDR family oxidoreductase [Paraburkholderia susongensis]SMG49123.1 NAD(P)-dependent dehydrogenase, short-chain alcohol dehydrogenase family [Paraburkholderia susongensis]